MRTKVKSTLNEWMQVMIVPMHCGRMACTAFSRAEREEISSDGTSEFGGQFIRDKVVPDRESRRLQIADCARGVDSGLRCQAHMYPAGEPALFLAGGGPLGYVAKS